MSGFIKKNATHSTLPLKGWHVSEWISTARHENIVNRYERKRRTGALKIPSAYRDSSISWMRSIFLLPSTASDCHRLQNHKTKRWAMLEESSRTVVTFIHQMIDASSQEQRKALYNLSLSGQLLAHFRDKLSWMWNQAMHLTCSGPEEIKSANLHHLFLRKSLSPKNHGVLLLGKEGNQKNPKLCNSNSCPNNLLQWPSSGKQNYQNTIFFNCRWPHRNKQNITLKTK